MFEHFKFPCGATRIIITLLCSLGLFLRVCSLGTLVLAQALAYLVSHSLKARDKGNISVKGGIMIIFLLLVARKAHMMNKFRCSAPFSVLIAVSAPPTSFTEEIL